MINKTYNYAIIGASNNQEKYWYIVSKDLIDAGYKVFLVNPKENKILWQKIFSSINEIPQKIDVAIFIVPPKIWESEIVKVQKLWIKKVRLQPWAENDKIIKFCQENNIDCIHNACIMIQKTFKS